MNEISVDVSGADLSNLQIRDPDLLTGVIWTHDTIWPAGLDETIRARSREIHSGVYQIQDGTERDPHESAWG